ncbi:MgtC/SapB family protein [Cognaticolwellia beringensis]|uniref:Protein MgtC n=1 Tax=Cognaticolwellia beringensis TaxID=1967665 RepID=A0A222G937_9GAMM|nr:MgtC/SapB family protein [Cognaticolwellia beringensis]ASP47864.1 magnesium transporter MgtC [Cognaticolwellia beringensis]
MELFDINIDEVMKNLMQLLIALVLPFMTAWEREASSRSAGLRTFPLVSMAACTFTILAMSIFNDQDAQSKVIAGIVTGIGFIGGGAILKDSSQVSGTSTAAAIWSTGAIGIAVGLERIEIAIALSIMTFATLKVIGRVKKEVPKE